MWAILAASTGIIVGVVKGRLLFRKNCMKNLQRIEGMSDPRVWQCFKPGLLIFLAVIIPTGALMSKTASGNHTLLCLIGALDLSISFALFTSGQVFWSRTAFRRTDG